MQHLQAHSIAIVIILNYSPNTESSVQKLRGLKPDRPDILVKAYGYEIMYGEITGPCRATSKAKTNWDLFRLARFGKTFLDKGNDSSGARQRSCYEAHISGAWSLSPREGWLVYHTMHYCSRAGTLGNSTSSPEAKVRGFCGLIVMAPGQCDMQAYY